MRNMERLTRSEIEDLFALQRYVREWFEHAPPKKSFRIHRSLMTGRVQLELVEWARNEGYDAEITGDVVGIARLQKTICPACRGEGSRCTLCETTGEVDAPVASGYFAAHPEVKQAITIEMPATKKVG